MPAVEPSSPQAGPRPRATTTNAPSMAPTTRRRATGRQGRWAIGSLLDCSGAQSLQRARMALANRAPRSGRDLRPWWDRRQQRTLPQRALGSAYGNGSSRVPAPLSESPPQAGPRPTAATASPAKSDRANRRRVRGCCGFRSIAPSPDSSGLDIRTVVPGISKKAGLPSQGSAARLAPGWPCVAAHQRNTVPMSCDESSRSVA